MKSTSILLISFLLVLPSLTLAWEGKVFSVKGKKITIATGQSAGVQAGNRLFILRNDELMGEGRVTSVFHTKVEMTLLSGSAAKNMLVSNHPPPMVQEVKTQVKSSATKWRVQKLPVKRKWLTIAHGNGVFVMLTMSEKSVEAAVSQNGISWKMHPLPVASTIWQMTFGNGIFVALGAKRVPNADESKGYIGISMLSRNGIDWEIQTLPELAHNWDGITYGNGLFVATGGSFDPHEDSQAVSAVSIDGIRWGLYQKNGRSWGSTIGGNGVFVTLLDVEGVKKMGISTNGADWKLHPVPDEKSWGNLVFGNGFFLSTVEFGRKAFISTDGIHWIEKPTVGARDWQMMIFVEDKFVAVKENKIGSSTDGINWILSSLPKTDEALPSRIIYGDGRFVLMWYESNYVMTSP